MNECRESETSLHIAINCSKPIGKKILPHRLTFLSKIPIIARQDNQTYFLLQSDFRITAKGLERSLMPWQGGGSSVQIRSGLFLCINVDTGSHTRYYYPQDRYLGEILYGEGQVCRADCAAVQWMQPTELYDSKEQKEYPRQAWVEKILQVWQEAYPS